MIYGTVVIVVILYFPSGISGALTRAGSLLARPAGTEQKAV